MTEATDHYAQLLAPIYLWMAIDTSATLLAQLRQLGDGLDIRPLESDLRDFAAHLAVPPALIPCMGDTLTHLPSASDVDRLCDQVGRLLAPGGRFVTRFRDYTHPARGDARFIPVRADADRIHTCFLEEEPERIRVHDIVHERQGSTWSMRVSHDRKLRLHPDHVAGPLAQCGLAVRAQQGPRGMMQIVAVRQSWAPGCADQSLHGGSSDLCHSGHDAPYGDVLALGYSPVVG